jgi:hypothetical protein
MRRQTFTLVLGLLIVALASPKAWAGAGGESLLAAALSRPWVLPSTLKNLDLARSAPRLPSISIDRDNALSPKDAEEVRWKAITISLLPYLKF